MLLRSLEDKRFLPVGSDKEVQSDFQLIAGTNCDLSSAISASRFREDLMARINLWTFELPALRNRREDIEPNLRFELEQYARKTGSKITFNKEAQQHFLRFAKGPESTWAGNFRDLNAAVTRMATLAAGGRITTGIVDEEIARLRAQWSASRADPSRAMLEQYLGDEQLECIDPFDRVQLAEVIRACAASHSLSEAGRLLFSASRLRKESINDADRLRKYLARFSLDWKKLQSK
jgi:transcriptional regulatory protein RtcR